MVYISMPEDERHKPKKTSMTNCIPQELVIKNVRLAAAYVPYHTLCQLLSPLEALKKGTVFLELYSPYEPKDKRRKDSECE